MKTFLTTLIVFVGIVAFAASANAGVILFAESPDDVAVGADTPIVLKARLTESINALKAVVTVDPDTVEIIRFDDADSAVRLWLQRGVVTDDGVVLEGVIPGGFGPAFTDEMTIGTLWLRPTAPGTMSIAFTDVEVYLNQPTATLSDVETRKLEVSVGDNIGNERPATAMPIVMDADVRVVRDESLFDGARALVFDVKTDRGTVDRIRIRERWLGVWGTWREVVSPSTLSDSWGVSILDAALSDADGGAHIASVVPLSLQILWGIVGLGILTIFTRLYILRR